MAAIPKIALGAPNIYRIPDQTRRTLGGVQMDVCAFVGVAPRGPVRVPIEPESCVAGEVFVESVRKRQRSVARAVESWDEYLHLYGGFEGPGRLPYAVASFFEQGGRKAYIVRIVPDYGSTEAGIAKGLEAVAEGELSNLDSGAGAVKLVARNEGSWGNSLRAAIGFTVTPIEILPESGAAQLLVDLNNPVPIGALLRLSVPVAGEDRSIYELRFVSLVRKKAVGDEGDLALELTLDLPLTEIPEYVEVIEGNILIDDGVGTLEQFKGVGLSPQHPRWLAWVLYSESALVYPHEDWVATVIRPLSAHHVSASAQLLLNKSPARFSGGEDRYSEILHEDFFDSDWVLGNETPGSGVHALTHLKDLSSLVVPDLYVPESLPDEDDTEEVASLAGASFAPCVHVKSVEEEAITGDHELSGLLLDPAIPGELAQITTLQERLAELADLLRNFVVLLDVPPGLSQRNILRWRAHFHTSYAAAYYPWLKISQRDDSRDDLILINPSAVAAGIIAQRELTFGVPHGPANVVAENVVKVDERISPVRHDELHPLGINIYLQERDGAWLSAGRTLSRDKRYRQLSVRRLMLMLRRALEQQMHWMVFEPNTPSLWSEVRHMLNNYLRQLFIAGAFKGESEEEAFFVRCDAELNHRRIVDAGQMIAEIGVAPAEPLEFIAVRITRGGDGTLAVES